MSKTVWKFKLDVDDEIEIVMPKGSKVLHVDTQFGVPMLWALCDPKADQEVRSFRIAGTGHPLPEDDLVHLGTFLIYSGRLVFHLFEKSAGR